MIMTRKPISERIVHSCDDWLRIRHNGRRITIQPSAIIFNLGIFHNIEVTPDQSTIDNVKTMLKPLSFVSLKYSSFKKLAHRLSTFAQPTTPQKWRHPKHLKITGKEVEWLIRDCLERGQYLTIGQNIFQIYFVVNSFLERKPISEDSEWIIILGKDRRGWFSEYMKTSAQEEMLKHRSIIPSQGYKKEEKEKGMEERLFEKLKKRLKK